MENKRVYVKVLRGFLANTSDDTHPARKITEDGKVYYEVNYGGYRVVLSSDDVIEHERYFLVLVVATATDNNPSYAGAVRKYIYGKHDELIFTDSEDITAYKAGYDKLYASDIRKYGYTRRQDAKRCYSYTHPDNNGYWTSKAYVVEYDVCGSEVTEV